MYEIAICEDETIFSQALEKMCRELLEEMGAGYRIRVFPGATPFLAAFEGQEYHLYLLDVVMEGMNGMELARRIRERDRKGTIIFTTSSPEYAVEGYGVGAADYLLKPVDREKLRDRLRQDFHTNYLHTVVILSDGDRKVRMPVTEIIYLEMGDHKITVHTEQGVYTYAGRRLGDLLDRLPPDQFVRCHQGFAVNLRHMEDTKRYSVNTPAGEVPVSRSYVKDARAAFLRSVEMFPWKTGGSSIGKVD